MKAPFLLVNDGAGDGNRIDFSTVRYIVLLGFHRPPNIVFSEKFRFVPTRENPVLEIGFYDGFSVPTRYETAFYDGFLLVSVGALVVVPPSFLCFVPFCPRDTGGQAMSPTSIYLPIYLPIYLTLIYRYRPDTRARGGFGSGC